MTRKVYVTHPVPLNRHEITPSTRRDKRLDDTGIFFTTEPTWIMTHRATAETRCAGLDLMRVHINSQVCEFAVESLHNGRFTVVCLNHPKELALARPKYSQLN